jgi:DNA (cytosine-5)-methyltransferase 1
MIKVIELFAGIGSQTQALKNANIEHEVVAISEIDRYACESYKLLHGEVLNLGDVSEIDIANVPDCDLLTYTFPCTDLSIAGHQLGASEDSGTRSSLLWECKKIIQAKKPQYLLMENVKNMISTTHLPNFNRWLETLEQMGYTNYWQVLNAIDYGIPQNRERVFVVSILNNKEFEFPKKQERVKTMKDIIQNKDIPNSMYMDREYIPRENPQISDNGLLHLGNVVMPGNESIKRVYSVEGACPTLTTMGGGHRQPKILTDDGRVRKLTPYECWLLMGFTPEQFDKVKGLSNTQLYKQAGNTIAVPCLSAIFINLLGE